MPAYTALHVSGHDVWLPAALAEHDEAHEAVEALLSAAEPHYNRALAAQAEGHVPEALRAIAAALRFAPYSARLAELAVVLAIKHGAFGDAQARLRWADASGMSAHWPDYRAALDDAVRRWNRFVEDTDALRAHYRSPDASVSYRELLLLAHRLGAPGEPPLPSDAERAHLAAVHLLLPSPAPAIGGLTEEPAEAETGDASAAREAAEAAPTAEDASPVAPTRDASPSSRQRTRRPLVAAGVAGVLGLLLGLGGAWASGLMAPPATTEPATAEAAAATASSETNDTPAPGAAAPTAPAPMPPLASALARAHLDLLQGRPLDAYAALDTLQAPANAPADARAALSALRAATRQALYDAGLAAWDRRATAKAVRLLAPLENADVGEARERLYVLGMAAAEEGRSDLAVRALRRLQSAYDLTPAYPHYDAQAAYTLVTLLPDAEARPYAERIATRYADTIYNNSVVQAHR